MFFREPEHCHKEDSVVCFLHLRYHNKKLESTAVTVTAVVSSSCSNTVTSLAL